MTADLQEVSSELNRDLAPQWLDLSARVRALAQDAPSSPVLAEQALRLCDHVDRLHADVQQFLTNLREESVNGEFSGPLETLPKPPPEKVDEANLQIQREMHQKSDLQQIIKALFMWKDDPEERVRKNVD